MRLILKYLYYIDCNSPGRLYNKNARLGCLQLHSLYIQFVVIAGNRVIARKTRLGTEQSNYRNTTSLCNKLLPLRSVLIYTLRSIPFDPNFLLIMNASVADCQSFFQGGQLFLPQFDFIRNLPRIHD